MKIWMSTIVAVGISSAMAVAASASEPRALVMDIVGDSQPVIDAFDELDAGSRIVLSGDAELSITFYPTCEDVTVRGGTVTISDAAVTVDKGTVVSSAKGDCPSNVKLAPSDIINAAIITRAARPVPTISARPMIAVVGSDGYSELSVHDTNGQILSVAMDGRSAIWPESAAPLTIGGEYLVVLKGNGVQMRVAKVVATADAPRVTVLRQ